MAVTRDSRGTPGSHRRNGANDNTLLLRGECVHAAGMAEHETVAC